MDFFKWLRLLIGLAGKIDLARLLKLPDIQDSGDTQAWVACVLDAGGVLTELTPTDVDDEALAALKVIVEDDEAWAAVFGFLQVLVADDKVGDSSEPSPLIQAAGEKTNINPLLIITIIKALAELWKWLRDRKADK